MTEQFENDLLMEFEGLDRLARAYAGIDLILQKWTEEYADFCDPNLVTLVEMVRYDLNITLSGVVKLDNQKVDGIYKQLENVADEVQVFRCGLPNKKGVQDEDSPDEGTERGGQGT